MQSMIFFALATGLLFLSGFRVFPSPHWVKPSLVFIFEPIFNHFVAFAKKMLGPYAKTEDMNQPDDIITRFTKFLSEKTGGSNYSESEQILRLVWFANSFIYFFLAIQHALGGGG